jgi:hypothetical protein
MAGRQKSIKGIPSPFTQSETGMMQGPIIVQKPTSNMPADFKYVIAIDFGTTRSAYAAGAIHKAFPPDSADFFAAPAVKSRANADASELAKEPTMLLLRIGKSKPREAFDAITAKYLKGPHVPILADDNISIGTERYKALCESAEEGEDLSDWYVAQDFKMLLDIKTRQEQEGKKVVDLKGEEVPLRCLNDDRAKDFRAPLLDIIALYLRVVGEVARRGLHESCKSTQKPPPENNDDITWVITVPAIWRDQARVFMRKAAMHAGLVSNPMKMRLCLEPEGAALQCFSQIEFDAKQDFLHKGDAFMMCDLGGGTADISVHRIATFDRRTRVVEFEEVHPPSGGDWGGRVVNRNLMDAVLEPTMRDKYPLLASSSKLTYMTADLEELKRSFSSSGDESLRLHVESILGLLDTKFTSSGEIMVTKKHIKFPSKLIKTAFDAVLDPIIRQVQNLLVTLKDEDIKCVMLVGGMCANDYVYTTITEFMSSRFPSVKVFRPPRCGMAVVLGATRVAVDDGEGCFGARIARATYGLSLYNRKNTSKSLFSTLVNRGESLRDVEAKSKLKPFGPYMPVTEEQTSVSMEFYETDANPSKGEVVPEYVTDHRCAFIASAAIPIDVSLPFDQRVYQVRLSLTGPTIRAFVICPDRKEIEISWETR